MTEEKQRWSDILFKNSGFSGKARCEPNWSWQPPPLKDFDLWYAVLGKGEMKINQVKYDIRPGSCFLVQPGDEVNAKHDPTQPLTVLYCHFTVEGDQQQFRLPDFRHVLIQDTYRLEPLLHQLVDIAIWKAQADADEFDLLLKIILSRWIKQGMKQNVPAQHYYYDQIVHRVLDEIRFRLSEKIDYEALAASVGLTPRYVSALMKRHTGLSLKETITKLRMERAIHLLSETAMSVTEVSDALAYSDIYTFSKLFKRFYGYAPTTIRQ